MEYNLLKQKVAECKHWLTVQYSQLCSEYFFFAWPCSKCSKFTFEQNMWNFGPPRTCFLLGDGRARNKWHCYKCHESNKTKDGDKEFLVEIMWGKVKEIQREGYIWVNI